jgi:hypothetical protein
MSTNSDDVLVAHDRFCKSSLVDNGSAKPAKTKRTKSDFSEDLNAGSQELKYLYAQLELLAKLARGHNKESIKIISDKYVTWESCFHCLKVSCL